MLRPYFCFIERRIGSFQRAINIGSMSGVMPILMVTLVATLSLNICGIFKS
jgi:hypothetical protein